MVVRPRGTGYDEALSVAQEGWAMGGVLGLQMCFTKPIVVDEGLAPSHACVWCIFDYDKAWPCPCRVAARGAHVAMQRKGARVRGYICLSGILSCPQGIGSVLDCCGGFISPICCALVGQPVRLGVAKIRQHGGWVCRATRNPEVG